MTITTFRPLRVAFRVDASVQIGTGHVMRCLTLADALHSEGVDCTFICRPHTGHLLDVIASRGHTAVSLPELTENEPANESHPAHGQWLGTHWETDATDTLAILQGDPLDWLVVDHYALDARWQNAVRPAYQKLFVIDDLADRPHACDVLLDQNLGRQPQDYAPHVNADTTLLIGPKYALLRPEFRDMRVESLARRATPSLSNILISMGGVDQGNVTSTILTGLDSLSLPTETKIKVVMGQHAPHLKSIKRQAQAMHCETEVLSSVTNMARLMTDCDIAFGAAGSTSWERCCLGVPSVMVVLADNQIGIANALHAEGAAISTRDGQTATEAFKKYFLSDSFHAKYQWLSNAAVKLTNGTGTQDILREMARRHA